MAKMGIGIKTIVSIVVGLMVFAIIFPIGLGTLVDPANWMYNSTDTIWDVAENGATLQTLVLTLLPILVVVGVIMYFIPRKED